MKKLHFCCSVSINGAKRTPNGDSWGQPPMLTTVHKKVKWKILL